MDFLILVYSGFTIRDAAIELWSCHLTAAMPIACKYLMCDGTFSCCSFTLTGIPPLKMCFLLIFIQCNSFRKNAKVQKRGKINLIGRLQLTTERMREEENEGIVQLRILRTQASKLPEEYKMTLFLVLYYRSCMLSMFGCWCMEQMLLNPIGTYLCHLA